MTAALPVGSVLVADPATTSYDDGRVLLGGSPRRVLRLTDSGAGRARELLAGTALRDDVDAALARRLLDAGLAHPALPVEPRTGTFDVVVPAYGAGYLRECLSALRDCANVTVVDDGSPDHAAVASAAASAGASVVRSPENRGPAHARNAGLAATSSPLVAFVDSDAEVSAKTLGRLAALFDDPAVAAAAPRIHPAGSRLDMGERAAVARPGARTSYVPSTVLLVRRSAIEAIGGFDERLRVGEDVDLVWRLAAAGWTVRYVPEFPAAHHEPNWFARLRRSARYGTATGPLARRHPGAGTAALSPPVLPVAAVLLACLGRPRLATAVLAVAAAGPARRLHAAGVPAPQSAALAANAALTSGAHSARWVAQVWSPALVAAAWRAYRRRDRNAGLALAAAALGPTRLIDDIAYGAGVWTGCVRTRSFWPLVPRLGRR